MIEPIKMNNDKFRLSCSLYELVEIWSMRNTEVDLDYMDENEQQQTYSGLITNVYSREGLEQVVLDDKLIIPTKNLITVNGVKFWDYMK